MKHVHSVTRRSKFSANSDRKISQSKKKRKKKKGWKTFLKDGFAEVSIYRRTWRTTTRSAKPNKIAGWKANRKCEKLKLLSDSRRTAGPEKKNSRILWKKGSTPNTLETSPPETKYLKTWQKKTRIGIISPIMVPRSARPMRGVNSRQGW